MSTSQVIVRHARKEDAPSILEMIKELADYEKELSSVETTIESLERTLAFAPSSSSHTTPGGAAPTDPSRPARCLLLFDESGTAAGMALYFYNYSTWRSVPGIYLEDLYVRPNTRGKGYGRRLLQELAREVVRMGGARLEWSVLKWNEPSIKFYRGIGAKSQDEWVGMRVDGDALPKLAGLDEKEA
ncbi:N-acetyltransferase ats1 [Plectosphaerella plurivora]|uniref:N-acetyltransferase ats1 n=1 Tax=Plectosphaerella plurivora TaxID=936078 RepID=A0A9P9A8Z4_9PEZI|nr:N-acetyltransferase ats1 [Plectosphaerella plurivora]